MVVCVCVWVWVCVGGCVCVCVGGVVCVLCVCKYGAASLNNQDNLPNSQHIFTQEASTS